MSKVIHVAKTGCDFADGSKANPFLTISKAAKVAKAGDTVIVHAGEYREWVKPENGGESDICRITYEAAKGEKVVIKGSERIEDWKQLDGTVWKVTLPNSFFGGFNPYKEPLRGDWYVWPNDTILHPGDVYLNGVSFFEARSLDEVKTAEKRLQGYNPPWSKRVEKIRHPEQTIYRWCCESDNESVTIYANFQGADPNKELVEINVRSACFYPAKPGVNYITVRGFEMAQAASPWTPPTADQPGLLGVHWSKGWVIEDNIIHDAKCSGISLGKEASTGHNEFTATHRKPGYQYQMESVFRALQIGWCKEKIGSHVVRNNVIYDCGQNGIVGHMGGAFSEISGNHIYNIAIKHEFFGFEIAGIKMHAAVDTYIHHNRIDHCTLGTWLDWQAQGTRVSNNLYYENDRDLMIEVTHGPCLVDNNIFGSEYNFDNVAQGTAFVGNLCCGGMRQVDVLDRATPYHFPHTTQVFGYAFVYGGDDRLYNNIFVGGWVPEGLVSGTSLYNGSPASYEEYIEKICEYDTSHDHDSYFEVKQPVYVGGNAYLNGATPFDRETDNYVSATKDGCRIVEEGNAVYLEIRANEGMLEIPTEIITTAKLGSTRIVEGIYDDPNGNPVTLDVDYLGNKRAEKPTVGPVEGLKVGANRIKIWG